jgi:aspartate aminotransferase-like enzyme
MDHSMNLRTPGPTPLPPEVRQALMHDMVDHRGAEFTEMYGEVVAILKDLFRTENETLIFTCSGTGGLEAAVANLFSPGEKILVASIGYFGDRFDAIAKAFGVDTVKVKFGSGQAADPESIQRALDAHPEVTSVLVTHNETSTGTTNDLQSIAKVVKAADKLFVVDGISSIGSIPLDTDAWGCDVVVTGSQKSWMIPPGLAFISVSPRAWEAHAASRLPRFYFDFTQARQSAKTNCTPWTPAVGLFFALQASLRLMKDEGLENILARHARLASFVRSRLKAMGLKLLVEDEARASDTVTAFWLPEGLDARVVQRRVLDEHDVNLAGAQGDLAGRVMRIGHLGYVQEPELDEALNALSAVLAPARVG